MLYIRDDTGKTAILRGSKSRSRARFSENRKASRCSPWKLVILQWNCSGAQRIWGHRMSLSAYVSVLVKRIRFSVESRLRRLFGSVSYERGWDSKNRRRGSWFTHRDGALSSKPVKALGDDRLWELANGQGDPPRRCRFTTSWKAIPAAVSALVLFSSPRSAALLGADGLEGPQSGVDFLSNNKFDWPANPPSTTRPVKYVPRSSNGCFISIGRF